MFSRVILRAASWSLANVPESACHRRKHGWQFDIMATSFFLSRRALKPVLRNRPCRAGRIALFILMARSASDASEFFQIPTGRVVEVGTQVTI